MDHGDEQDSRRNANQRHPVRECSHPKTWETNVVAMQHQHHQFLAGTELNYMMILGSPDDEKRNMSLHFDNPANQSIFTTVRTLYKLQ